MKKKILDLIKKYEEIIIYLVVGGITTVFNYLAYFFFSRITHLDYKTSTILSWLVAVFFAFFANKIIVFKSKSKNKKQFFIEMFHFLKYRMISLIIDVLLMMILIDIFHIHDLISKAIVQVIIVVVNYVFSKFFIFNDKKKNHLLLLDKSDKICLSLSFILLFLLFGIFLHDHFAMDTICLYYNGYLETAKVYFQNGRIVMYLFLIMMDNFAVPFILAKQISWFIGFFSLFGGIYTLYFILKKFTKNNILNILASILVVANIFVVEFFSFPEFTGIMCFGIFASVISSKYMIAFFEDNKKINLFKALMYSIFAMFSYQGVMAFIIIIPMIFTLKYSKNLREFIKRNFFVIVNYFIPCLLGVLYSFMIGGIARTKGNINICLSIQKIYLQLKYLIARAQGSLPTFWYAIIIMMIGFIIVWLINKEKAKNSKWKFLFLVYCSILIILTPLVPFFIVATEYIDLCGRSAIAIGSIVGFLLLFYIVNMKENKFFEKLSIVVSILMIFICNYTYQEMAMNRFIVNHGDEKEAKMIISAINEYEEENEITIHKIGYYKDRESTYTYFDSKYINSMTIRAMAIDWSNISYLGYFSSHELESVTASDEVKKKCSSNDWDEYDREQLYFDGDTLYICIY